jgi:hypothetical protein
MHSAMGWTSKDGKHECVERTREGDKLIKVVRSAVESDDPIGTLRRAFQTADIGRGDVQHNDEREYEQQYFVLVDEFAKVIMIDPDTYTLGVDPMRCIDLWVEFGQKCPNWTLHWAWDCPHFYNDDERPWG